MSGARSTDKNERVDGATPGAGGGADERHASDLSTNPRVDLRRKPVDPADGRVTRGEAEDWARHDAMVLENMASLEAAIAQ